MNNTDNSTAQRPISHIFDFHHLMEEKNIMLAFCGEFSQDLNKTLLAFTERKFKTENIEDNTRRKIFNVMVEVLQNISKNKIENEHNSKDIQPLFMLGTSDNDYLIISSNLMENNKIEQLRNRLELVNSLDKEGLKLLYKDVRLNNTLSETAGAGIGMIDIARKSEHKLEFSFEEVDNEVSVFSLLIRITKQ